MNYLMESCKKMKKKDVTNSFAFHVFAILEELIVNISSFSHVFTHETAAEKIRQGKKMISLIDFCTQELKYDGDISSKLAAMRHK